MSNTPREALLIGTLSHLLTHYIADVESDGDGTPFKWEVVKEAINTLATCGYNYPEDHV